MMSRPFFMALGRGKSLSVRYWHESGATAEALMVLDSETTCFFCIVSIWSYGCLIYDSIYIYIV